MHEIQKIYPEEKPPEDQASYSEESSTQVFAQILVPLIADDVYSISIFFIFFLNFIRNISCMHVKNHMKKRLQTPCMHLRSNIHASRKTKRGSCSSDSILIFSKNNLMKKMEI
jgi:hypothetical protein